MKKALVSLVSLVPLVLLFAARADAFPCARKATVADAIADAETHFAPVGSCIVAISGSATVTHCMGTRNSSSGPAMDASTILGIGSITKSMTGTLLARRVQQGTIALADKVGPKIGWSLDPSITIGTLAHHTSGLQRTPYTFGVSKADFYRGVFVCVHDAPGCWDSAQPFEYSNYGFSILGDILADANPLASDWPDANKTEIMTPLGMTKTLTYDQWASWPSYFANHVASGHDGSSSPIPGFIDPETWHAAAGGLYSTIDDMETFLKYNMDLAGPAGMRALLPLIRTGLGWGIQSPADCNGTGDRISKNGALGGFNSYIGYDSVGNRGAVVLMNNEGSVASATDMGTYLMRVLP